LKRRTILERRLGSGSCTWSGCRYRRRPRSALQHATGDDRVGHNWPGFNSIAAGRWRGRCPVFKRSRTLFL